MILPLIFLVALEYLGRTQAGEIMQLTEAEKQEFVDAHNKWRKEAGATAMAKIRWNEGLAKFAESSAKNCKFEHSGGDKRSKLAGFDYVGENLYMGGGKPKPTDVVKLWGDEIKDYDLASNKCNKGMCGHYTQVVWAKSTDVGCGVGDCGGNFYVYCNYGPGGNFNGESPFKKGEPGSECQKQFKVDKDANGLCAIGGSEAGGNKTESDGNKTESGAKPGQKPHGKPQKPGGNHTKPGQKPHDKPHKPGQKPHEKPQKPGSNHTKPSQKPHDKPHKPGSNHTKPSHQKPHDKPHKPGSNHTKPGQKPHDKPHKPGQKPHDKPHKPGANHTKPGQKPHDKPHKPDNKPGQKPQHKPGKPADHKPHHDKPGKGKKQKCCVTLFENKNFGGDSKEFCGEVDFVWDWNDKADSLKVQEGCKATVYENWRYEGRHETVQGEVADLQEYSLDKQISSLKVKAA